MFTVIIPCFNQIEILKKTLAGFILQKKFPLEALEIILIDNNSAEDIESVYKKYFDYVNLYLIKRPKLQHTFSVASARNIGLKIAKHKWIVSLDSDCIPNTYYLHYLQDYLQQQATDKHIIVGERIFVASDAFTDEQLLNRPDCLNSLKKVCSKSNYNLSHDRRFPSILTIHKQPHPWAYIHTGNAIFYRDHALAIGGFDEQYDGHWGYEDIDFAFRLIQKSQSVPTFLENIFCYHQEAPDVIEQQKIYSDRMNKSTNPNWKRICTTIPCFKEFKTQQYQQLNGEIQL